MAQVEVRLVVVMQTQHTQVLTLPRSTRAAAIEAKLKEFVEQIRQEHPEMEVVSSTVVLDGFATE